MQRGSFQWMKSLNRSIILNKIRRSGPISRAQIAKETKLTPPTVGSIVKELVKQNLVKETQLGISQGGRKPTMLEMDNSAFHIIGIDVGPNDMQFIISDLAGEIADSIKQDIAAGIDEEAFLQMMINGITRLKERHPDLEFIGIGVAMHGVVDADKGVAVFAPNLNLREIALKENLEIVFDLEVKVENDARALALGEAWFQTGKPANNMVAVNIGRGIGAGLVIGGKLYNGMNGIAGEIGHMAMDRHGKRCTCGNIGCLQTIAAGPAIVELATELLEAGKKSILSECISSFTAEDVHQAALKGDRLAIEVFEEAGTYLGMALTNLIHICNPDQIIIGGGVSKAGDFILKPAVETIQSTAISADARKTPVYLSALGDNGSALGAVALVLSELFQPMSE